MKKILVFSAFAFLISFSANAQSGVAALKKQENKLRHEKSSIKKEERVTKKELRKLEGNTVSMQAKQAFMRDFGNIPAAKWERTMNYDEVAFVKNGHEMRAYYDADANLVGTTSTKTFADIPAKAQKYINSKYHGYAKENVIFFEDNDLNETDMMLFNTQFEDADNYFVQLKKDNKELILHVNMSGDVSFFKQQH